MFLSWRQTEGSEQQEDEMIAKIVANLSAGEGRDNSTYQIGLNGLVIPDYSQNRGLSVLVEAKSKATESLAAAMCLMRRFPKEVLQRMSSHSQRFSKATKTRLVSHVELDPHALCRRIYCL
jgi:hypothetical protein